MEEIRLELSGCELIDDKSYMGKMSEVPREPTEQPESEACRFLRERLPATLQNPRIAIVCGSGLGGLADTINDNSRVEYEYGKIPHFPRPTGKVISLHSLASV